MDSESKNITLADLAGLLRKLRELAGGLPENKKENFNRSEVKRTLESLIASFEKGGEV